AIAQPETATTWQAMRRERILTTRPPLKCAHSARPALRYSPSSLPGSLGGQRSGHRAEETHCSAWHESSADLEAPSDRQPVACWHGRSAEPCLAFAGPAPPSSPAEPSSVPRGWQSSARGLSLPVAGAGCKPECPN